MTTNSTTPAWMHEFMKEMNVAPANILNYLSENFIPKSHLSEVLKQIEDSPVTDQVGSEYTDLIRGQVIRTLATTLGLEENEKEAI